MDNPNSYGNFALAIATSLKLSKRLSVDLGETS